MRVQITEIIEDDVTETITVSFSTPFGTSLGKWVNDRPELYKYYEVEFAVEPMLTWGKSIRVIDETRYLLDYVEEQLTVQGKLEAIEPDGIIYVRLGNELIMMDTTGTPPPLDVYVRAYPNLLALYPIEL